MLLYAEHISPRLRYVVDFISKEFFQEPVECTSDREYFLKSTDARINYSASPVSDHEFWIVPVNLLFETDISPQKIHCFLHNRNTVFFQTNSTDLPFDIFAATFYLISRYEEYLPSEKDACGRFAFENSLAWQEGFLNKPIVNCWLKDFKKLLLNKFPGLYFTYKNFKFIPTYNIDRAYAYVRKSWRQEITGAVQAVLKRNWKSLNQRNAVISGKMKDPFDAYEWLDALHLYCRLKPHFFFLLAHQDNNYDKNIPASHPKLHQLIEYYSSSYKVGIHPSWQSGDDPVLLKEEIELLEYISDRHIIHSRQHYLRMSLPETYRQLIKVGIRKDHSMGYGNMNGFRASVASSFYWYDLENDESTALVIFPFCFSDSNAFYHQKFKARQAFEELMRFYNAIKSVNGLMITVWHNHFLGTDPRFAGWREVYEIFLKDEVYWER